MNEKQTCPEACCLNCQFLSLESRTGPGKPREISWAKHELREALTREGYAAIKANAAEHHRMIGDHCLLGCYKKVWDVVNSGKRPEEIDGLLTCDRRESCFFYPDEPGMFFPVAEELERRAADRREAKKDRWHMITVAWISFTGAILAAIIVAWLSAKLSS